MGWSFKYVIITGVLLVGAVLFFPWFVTSSISDEEQHHFANVAEYNMFVVAATQAEQRMCVEHGHVLATWFVDPTEKQLKVNPPAYAPMIFGCITSTGEIVPVPEPTCNTNALHQFRRFAPSRVWARTACNLNIPEFRTSEEK